MSDRYNKRDAKECIANVWVMSAGRVTPVVDGLGQEQAQEDVDLRAIARPETPKRRLALIVLYE